MFFFVILMWSFNDQQKLMYFFSIPVQDTLTKNCLRKNKGGHLDRYMNAAVQRKITSNVFCVHKTFILKVYSLTIAYVCLHVVFSGDYYLNLIGL